MMYLYLTDMYNQGKSSDREEELAYGGKLILPPSMLELCLDKYNGDPMVFMLFYEDHTTHCGVEEFTADEGYCRAPNWVIDELNVPMNERIPIMLTTLPKGEFVKFKPTSCDFLNISDHKAVLEIALSSYSALTVGNTITIRYIDDIYKLIIEETLPEDAISTYNIDINVDFSPPDGYVDPVTRPPSSRNELKYPHKITLSGDKHITNEIKPISIPSGLLFFNRPDIDKL